MSKPGLTDFQKTFDVVHPKIQLKKIENLGLRGKINNRFGEYSTEFIDYIIDKFINFLDKWQYVSTNRVNTMNQKISTGFPQ